jgi:hypothetical protein
MAKPASLQSEEMNCVNCGATFGSRDAMEQHAGDVHVEGRGADARIRGHREQLNASGVREDNPNPGGLDRDQITALQPAREIKATTERSEPGRSVKIETPGGRDEKPRRVPKEMRRPGKDLQEGQSPQPRRLATSNPRSTQDARAPKAASTRKSSRRPMKSGSDSGSTPDLVSRERVYKM